MLIKVLHKDFKGVIMIDDRFKDEVKTFRDINEFILNTAGPKANHCLLESDKDWAMMENGDTIIATRYFSQPYMPDDPISQIPSMIRIQTGDELTFIKTQNGYIHAEWDCANVGCECGHGKRVVIMLPTYVSTPDIGLPPTDDEPDYNEFDNEEND